MVNRSPIHVLASSNPGRAAAAIAHGDVGVALYQTGRPELAGLGAGLADATASLPRSPSVRAWDFLSIALAVYAADRFLVRRESPDSWTRMIALEVELVEPEPWAQQAEALAETLRFLSSDIWYLRFRGGGNPPPQVLEKANDRDCACLFSGGLDSLIGAINLVHDQHRPLLVSQASPKEGPVQVRLAEALGLTAHRFEGRASERWRQPYEPSSRARSILFLGYGAMAASTLRDGDAPVDLIIPENGLISINAPLTARHIGSLSTRTTHPHFISSLQSVFDEVGLGVKLSNPYGLFTKGEMLAACRDSNLVIEDLAAGSYSCGKGKRLNQHCGRCVPCLIRRASFHAAGIHDATPYWAQDLSQEAGYVDVAAVRFAATRLGQRDVGRWARQAGPLPGNAAEQAAYVEVVRRGTQEVADFLATVRWP